MATATTQILLVHSSCGVAALIVGLKCFGDDGYVLTQLPKLWPAIRRPGGAIYLGVTGVTKTKVICMNSGNTPVIAQRLLEGVVALWGARICPHHAREGKFCKLRFWLFLLFPAQKWLLAWEFSQRYEP